MHVGLARYVMTRSRRLEYTYYTHAYTLHTYMHFYIHYVAGSALKTVSMYPDCVFRCMNLYASMHAWIHTYTHLNSRVSAGPLITF